MGTEVNELELLRLLADAYALDGATADLIREGGDGNVTFRITRGDSALVLRVYGEQGRAHPDWVQFEVDLLAHLAGSGISVAAPIAHRDGSFITALPLAGGGSAPVVLFQWASGGVEWPTSPERAHLLGSSFGALHRVSGSLEASASPRRFDLDRILFAPLDRMRPYLVAAGESGCADLETLSTTADRVAELLGAIENRGGAVGPIHGDLHQGNCHFDIEAGGDRLTLFDFSNAGVGWRVYDLSGFLWPLRDDTIRDPAVRAACDAFLNGYKSIRPLSAEEERAIPAAVKARDYWEAGCWLEFGCDLDPENVRGGLHSIAEQFRRFPLE